MATNSVSINAIKWAYINQETPDTHYTIDHSTVYPVGDNSLAKKFLLIGLNTVPAALKRYRILAVDIALAADSLWIAEYSGDFDPETVTWNSGKPDVSASSERSSRKQDGNTVVHAEASWVDPSTDMNRMQAILQTRGFAVIGGSNVRTKKSNGGVDVVTVTYDSDNILHSVAKFIQAPESHETVDPRLPITWQWELKKHATNWYCMDESFRQTSAVFCWKYSEDETWNRISLTTEMTVTLPANTLQTGKAVDWYLETTDEDGTTSSSFQQRFSTARPHIYFSTRPNGQNVDIRNQISFSWRLSSEFGDFEQESATIYWRTSDREPWNTVTVGSQTSYRFPALTFPTSSTITWYMEATDTGGFTSAYPEQTFSTPTVVITPLTYPDGSDISTKIPHTFVWAYQNAVYTDYSQESATFFWQKIPSERYNAIEITGNVKSLTIPADTFPTNATIRWYVAGTDVGGTKSRTNQRTFDTVSTQITPQNCPTGGYQDPRYPITFSWFYASSIGDYTQQSAVLYWREPGDTEWNEIPVSGNVQTLTVPAQTFPVASQVEWYLAGTDTGGMTTMTEQFSFSTTASTAYAVCVKPVGQVEDGTKAITFSWIVKNDDGSLPLRTVLEWKYDTESQLEWKTLLDTVDTATEYTVPGETFHAGAVEWRISAYNRDLIQGPINAASFVCLMSPEAPAGLAATPVPRTTVRWQASGQEAYEVVIDGVTVAKQYGPSVYSYQQEEPLEDGLHHISVRVQGQYSLWSNFSETTIMVNNAPGNTVTLSGVFAEDAELAWALQEDDDSATANVYRDGIRIASIGGLLNFTDRFAVGEHSYYVEIWETDGNYSRSNTLTGIMETESTIIAEAAGGEWLRIGLTENSDNKVAFSWSQEYAMKHVLGSAYPIIETGKNITLTGNFSCAFSSLSDARKFEALQGKEVVLKSEKLNIITGVLTRLDKRVSHFYISYTFSLQQTNRKDMIIYET